MELEVLRRRYGVAVQGKWWKELRRRYGVGAAVQRDEEDCEQGTPTTVIIAVAPTGKRQQQLYIVCYMIERLKKNRSSRPSEKWTRYYVPEIDVC